MIKKSNNIGFILFFVFLTSIFPTFIFGILGIYSKFKTFIWYWDVLTIFAFFFLFFFIFKIKKFNKKCIIFIVFFLIVMFFQYITYNHSLNNKYVEITYLVLPFTYLLHFLYSFVRFKESSCEQNQEQVLKFYKLFILFVFISCIYNMIVNYNYIFNVSSITSKYVNISSFFSQRNAFGQLLLFGVFSCIYILHFERQKLYKFSLGLFLLNLLFTFSRSSIFTALIFLSIYFLFNSKLKNKKQLIIRIFLFVLIVLILVFGFNTSVIDFLNYYIFRVQDGLTGRNNVWGVALSNLNDYHIILGYGLGSSPSLLKTVDLTNSHNSFIEMLLSGGILLLLFYLIIYLIIFKVILKNKNSFKRKFYISVFLSFLIYTVFEKVLLFGTGYAPVMFTIFIVTLPLIDTNSNMTV